MKTILMIVLMISLSSCRSIPLMKDPIERCAIRLTYLGNETYSGKCRCHLYEITPENIGRVSESIDYSLEYCDRFVALRPSTSWAELRTWFEDLIFFYNQNKDNKKIIKQLKKNN